MKQLFSRIATYLRSLWIEIRAFKITFSVQPQCGTGLKLQDNISFGVREYKIPIRITGLGEFYNPFLGNSKLSELRSDLPELPGIYRRVIGAEPRSDTPIFRFAYFDGTVWYGSSENIEEAVKMYELDIISSHQNFAWQGLAEDPSAK